MCKLLYIFSTSIEQYTVVWGILILNTIKYFASSEVAIPRLFHKTHCLRLGCPRNNQIFFSVRTETNRNSICFSCFSVCFAKPKKNFSGLFRFFGPVSKQPKQTEFSRNKQKKIPPKIRGYSKPLIFFLGSNRNKPKLNLFRLQINSPGFESSSSTANGKLCQS
jgi:hypothetical protein